MTSRRILRLAAGLVAVATIATACGDSDAPESDVVLETSSTTSSAPSELDTGSTSGDDPGDGSGEATDPDDVGVETSEVVDDTSPTTTAPQAAQGTSLTDAARISTLGLGPVFMGDTLAEVAEKIGVELVPDEFGDETCRYYTAPGGPPGVLFMVAFDRIARVDIDDPSTITTRSGAGIGSTKQEILELFGDKIQVEPHPFGPGEYLVFVPVDEKDANLRIVFETNEEDVVVKFRTGQRPEVEYTEGCS